MINERYRIYLPIAFSLVFIIGIVLGSYLNQNPSSGNIILPIGKAKTNKIDNILDYIERDYVDTVDRGVLEKDAVNAMLEELDPHSAYITASDFHEINDPLLGSFEGIGISFRIEKDSITVINTIPGGPSEKVGLMAGDRIVRVNDTLVAGNGITNNKAIRKLKGPKGTIVKVTIYRRGVPKLLDFKITRDIIPTYSLDVSYMVSDEIGYIKLNKFSATTYNEFKKALDELIADGMQKLILDLRGNPGGFLNAAINIADEFLTDGELIVYTEGKNRPRNYAFADGKGEFIDKKLIVLIDEGSASASEIVAGAIQDNDRGTIIGRRSFGKGLVQEQMNMADGSALRLTVAKYYTPTGRCIQKPYVKDDFDDYYTESYHRYLSGEMESADSIHFNDSLKFVTKGGKVVYGGGGIMPDIYVPLSSDTLRKFYNILANKGILFQFAFDYTDKYREELNRIKDFESFDKEFRMSDKEFKNLLEYAKDKGIEYTAEDTDYSKEKIKVLFKAFVGRNVLNEAGFYPTYHKIDDTFKRAVEEFQKK
jgi:carboxyl-terminal processing protease